MLLWIPSEPFPDEAIKQNSDLEKFLIRKSDDPAEGKRVYNCPVTSYGYDGLHVFLYGICKDLPEWTIDPRHPELLGNSWMNKNYQNNELDDLADLLADLHIELGSMTEETFEVSLSNVILPVHEEEVLDLYVRPWFGGIVSAMRPDSQRFNIAAQMKKIQLIHDFVNLSKQFGADLVWISIYGR